VRDGNWLVEVGPAGEEAVDGGLRHGVVVLCGVRGTGERGRSWIAKKRSSNK
jgi:hypothetical protein